MPLHFDQRGLLPIGDHVMTLSQMRSSIFVMGRPGGSLLWDRSWRDKLLDNLESVVGQLIAVGIQEIFIDGSYVEEKDHPGDIDGYFVLTNPARLLDGKLEKQLNAIDPEKAWGWGEGLRKPHPASPGRTKLPLWHAYRVEMFPHYGQPSGIVDKFGNPLPFPALFRRRASDDEPKGIVKLQL